MKTTILVSYDAGWGNQLTLRGSAPLSWDSGLLMDPVGPSTWKLELEIEEPLDFKPLYNDQVWAFGHRDYRVNPGETLTILPHFFETPGFADSIGYIPYKGRDITVRLYNPPGYRENVARRYPVVYCVDGQDLFEPPAGQGSDGNLDEHLNALIESRVTEPLLLVGVDFAEPGDLAHGRAHAAKAEEMAAFMLFLKGTIDRAYPTRPESCGLLGDGAGGLFALWLARRHPRHFPRVAAMGPVFWWADDSLLQEVALSEQHAHQMVYLDAGDGQGEGVEKLAEALRSDGWEEGQNLKVEVLPANPGSWSSRVGVPLGFLFPWSGL